MRRALLLLASAVGILVLLAGLTSRTYRIVTPAMEETLHCAKPTAGCLADESDRIAVSRVVYKLRDPKRDDVVAYRISRAAATVCGAREKDVFVHRIVAVPGDEVSAAGGSLLVNGKRVAGSAQSKPAATVRADRYFVVGDNESRPSCDSRRWGYVARSAIVGPKIATYWPLRRISLSIG